MRWLVVVAAYFSIVACDTVYYSIWDKLGVQKRDIMVKRVESARDAEKEAQEQFKSALDHFRAVVTIEGGELEKRYDELQGQYDKSEERAKAVTKRIDEVQNVAEDLFKEWNDELGQYTSAELRAASGRQLKATRVRYDAFMKQMREAEKVMHPVLAKFHDQVLFLKHNLNAQAVGSLKNEHARIESDVNQLINEMENAIKQADSFVDALKSDGTPNA
jgi:hypothetical protein